MERKTKKRKLDHAQQGETLEFEADKDSTKIDRFIEHFETNFDDSFWVNVTNGKNKKRTFTNSSNLGELRCTILDGLPYESVLSNNKFGSNVANSLKKSNVKKFLLRNWAFVTNSLMVPVDNTTAYSLTPLQSNVWHIIDNYIDFYCPEQTLTNLNEFRSIYLLHALNHVLKGRQKILLHNSAIKEEKQKAKKKRRRKVTVNTSSEISDKIVPSKLDEVVDIDSEDKFRDQGFTRPRVLILTPFRSGALKIVEIMSALLFGDKEKKYIKNWKRFYEEYGFEESEDNDGKVHFPRPSDYKQLFSGNTDDCFRIGLSVAKKSLKLYAEFYSSDIIVASPLGIRSATGSTDDKDFNADFLSSIELLIMDQTDIFLMQNWNHVIHIFENLNKRPDKSHDVDFTRVRHWSLDGRASFYRQTLLFSSVNAPEMKNIFSKFCHNFDGLVCTCPNYIDGVLSQITVEFPQAFYRFASDNNDPDSRFEFFTNTILPQFQNSPSTMRRTLIFVSSYFDFVRLRNSMKKNDASFVQVCEYAEERKISRARDLFYHEKKQFMLFTERFHFFKRYKIRGIRNLIFYQLPVYPQFYSEICNMLEDQKQQGNSTDVSTALTCTVIFSRYDALRLAPIVGNEKTRLLLESEKRVHMLVAGNNDF